MAVDAECHLRAEAQAYQLHVQTDKRYRVLVLVEVVGQLQNGCSVMAGAGSAPIAGG
jgi:hypothetical protein